LKFTTAFLTKPYTINPADTSVAIALTNSVKSASTKLKPNNPAIKINVGIIATAIPLIVSDTFVLSTDERIILFFP